MTVQQLAVDGIHLNSVVWEPVASPPPGGLTWQSLMLIHGFTGCAASWEPLARIFVARGLRVIALDLPGHGYSDAPEDPACYTVTRSAAYIATALRNLGIDSRDVILLGYSLGGRIALATALSQELRALILESASAGLATEPERAARRAGDEALATRIERHGIPAFVDEWERLPLFASQRTLPAERRQMLHAQRLRNRTVGLANSLRGAGTGSQPYLGERLDDLHLPTLLIAGALDEKYRTIAADMAERIPTARTMIVAQAGHAVHFEQPEVFASTVLDFVHGLAPTQ